MGLIPRELRKDGNHGLSMVVPQEEGGLGFKSLRMILQAFGIKATSVILKTNTIWAKFMKNI